jgi:hypothetical protein
MMELILSADDVRTLRDLLADHLHELRREIARTEAKDFRHVLVLRQELIERLLAQIEASLAAKRT